MSIYDSLFMTAWPDDALRDRAGTIGQALQELIDNEPRWIHRRIERLELATTTQAVRRVDADLTVPPDLKDALRYTTHEEHVVVRRGRGRPRRRARLRYTTREERVIVPLAVLPKAPLVDFVLEPKDVQRLTADQSNALVVGALTPLAKHTGARLSDVLGLLRLIVRNEQQGGENGSKEFQWLDTVLESATNKVSADKLRKRAKELDDNYILIGILTAPVGAPTRVAYSYRQRIDATDGGVDDPPLEISVELPHASGAGPGYRLELVAPDGLEVEAAKMVAGTDVLEAETEGGPFVHLRAPDSANRRKDVRLQATFRFPPGGIDALAMIAGATSTAALWLAVAASYALDETMKGGSASAFLAAPALVTGLVLGFSTTPVTSRAVNRLRIAAFAIALLGVLGGLTVALLGESSKHLETRHGILIALAILSTLIWGGWPVRAWLRTREWRKVIRQATGRGA